MYIENQYVSFSLVEKNIFVERYVRISSIAFLTLFTTPILYIFVDAMLVSILVIAGVTTMIFVGLKIRGINEYDTIGKITFFYDCFEIDDGLVTEVAITEIDEFNFKFDGYKDEPVFRRSSKSGYGNYLTIRTKETSWNYEVMISNQIMMRIFERLVNHFEVSGLK